MDKKKFKVTVKGKTTITQNRFGSNNKRVSAIRNESTSIESAEEFRQYMDRTNSAFDIEHVISCAEEEVLNWLKSTDLPIKKWNYDDSIELNDLLNSLKEHIDIKGVNEAIKCLSDLNLVRRLTKGAKESCNENSSYTEISANYEDLVCHSLHLLKLFDYFKFSIAESTLYLGSSRVEGMIKKSTKLTDKKYNVLFEHFESLDKTRTGRKLTKTEKWDIV
ncbi:MAG: hypothetical protein KUG78_08465, partial [Kangiellaceae bacterium]|nr:hypothetical protein [Kangiellaceae bacterium]